MISRISLAAIMATLAFGALAAGTTPSRQAEDGGVRTCKKAIDNIANFLIEDREHSSLSTWNNINPDTRIFNSQIAVKYSDGVNAGVFSVALTKSGKCDGSYTTVGSWENSCAIVREKNLKNWEYAGNLNGLITLKNKNDTINIILLPVGSGCASIKTEVVYE